MRGVPLFCFLTIGLAPAAVPPEKARFATYNTSLFRASAGALIAELNNPAGTTASIGNIHQVAEVIQRVAPDVILVNEFDYDEAGEAARLFHDNFLAVPQKPELAGLSFPYRFVAPSNTGTPSGFDLDNNGAAVTATGTDLYGNDCFGFGWFPGQYGFVVYSRFPIRTEQVRTFRNFLWKNMPGATLFANSGNPPLTTYYTAAERDALRLSSKNHVDLPIDLGGGHLTHFLVSHPTPPNFDAAENRNGKRNLDEIRFWADYIEPARSTYHIDDKGVPGGLAAGERFVIAGDQNADPNDGDPVDGVRAARLYTTSPRIDNSFTPVSAGAASYTNAAGNSHTGPKNRDTAAFASTGGLRVDNVLPSHAGFSISSGAVFWPAAGNALRSLVTDTDPSDHHLVWLDLVPEPSVEAAVRNLDAARIGDSIRITWAAAALHTYSVEQTENLTAGPWSLAGVPDIDPETFAATLDVPAVPGGSHFFRVRVAFAP